jgi:hypothetical protein
MLTIHEVELQARQAIARAKAGKQSESSIVELKSVWIPKNDLGKTARRIAALANAAHGQPVIWVVGVDEGNGTVVGADEMELANWWPQMKSKFDSVAPTMLHNAPFEIDGLTVVALCFDTARAPFVVKCTSCGYVEREIPWREGNSTRSASRDEVLRMLKPMVELPHIEIRDASLMLGYSGVGPWVMASRLTCDVTTMTDRKLHVLHERVFLTAAFPGTEYPPVEFDKWNSPMRGQDKSSDVRDDGTQITIQGPGTLILERSGLLRFKNCPELIELTMRMEFSESRGNPLFVEARFARPDTNRKSRTDIGGRQLDIQVEWDLQRDQC